jgi:excisionase family DNA binding protein
MPKPFLHYSDVAEMLDVDKRTVQRWVAEGRLKPARFGTRTVRFMREDVDRFVRDVRDRDSQPA